MALRLRGYSANMLYNKKQFDYIFYFVKISKITQKFQFQCYVKFVCYLKYSVYPYDFNFNIIVTDS